jgi:polar amino acid transport system permease protein
MLDLLPQWMKDGVGDDVLFWIGYFTNTKHLTAYASVQYTLFAAVLGATCALVFGIGGAALKNARFFPLRLVGNAYVNLVRGVPDVLFFLFFPLAFEQVLEWFRAGAVCAPEDIAARAGQWPPCAAANLFFGTTEYLLLASLSLGIIYGAYSANVISGALRAVPRGQMEAARAFGMSENMAFRRIQVRQMWIYALPGLSNVWMLLIKSTSLLSLLQVVDIVTWADRLGSPNFTRTAGLIHPDWRWQYYLVLLLFYILLTYVSEKVFAAVTRWAGRGMIQAEAA